MVKAIGIRTLTPWFRLAVGSYKSCNVCIIYIRYSYLKPIAGGNMDQEKADGRTVHILTVKELVVIVNDR